MNQREKQSLDNWITREQDMYDDMGEDTDVFIDNYTDARQYLYEHLSGICGEGIPDAVSEINSGTQTVAEFLDMVNSCYSYDDKLPITADHLERYLRDGEYIA